MASKRNRHGGIKRKIIEENGNGVKNRGDDDQSAAAKTINAQIALRGASKNRASVTRFSAPRLAAPHISAITASRQRQRQRNAAASIA
jgi:hypothetical protein